MMNGANIESVLAKVPLFKELTSEDIKRLVNIGITRTYPRGSHVFLQDDPLEQVFFIYSGKIKIYRNDSNGREQIVSILETGDMFPHVGFFGNQSYPAFAQAVNDTNLFTISISNFEQLLLQYPSVCIKLFGVMGETIIDLHDRLEAQILNNTYEQIVKLLLRLSVTHGNDVGENKRSITTHFTNKDLASMIGTTRETVSRTLSKLKKMKLIESNSDGHYTLDVEALYDELA